MAFCEEKKITERPLWGFIEMVVTMFAIENEDYFEVEKNFQGTEFGVYALFPSIQILKE